ncbi:hypothetical protein [Tautonia plasticadhaerens]|uniref:Uncharacterized protein n=1 Tax=Tautonia plasticadhaerens TaxID=2527974 RepID=A0A518GZP2_9BACT|nr:hypothetical protein [Tautonia plasticadhaerens]QDV34046.1 hypothetical protein ElP_19270 [Tautonia plasticadhaerens]
MADAVTITLEAADCLRIYRQASAAHLEAAGDEAGEPARRLDDLVEAVEAAGDPDGALAFVLLGSILTTGDAGERGTALELLAGLPTGDQLMTSIGRASRFDPADREAAFRDAAAGCRAGPGPGRE